MAQTTSLVFNGGVIPSPTPVPSGTGKAKLLKIGEITITEQGVQVTKNVICDPDSVISVAPFMEVLTSAKLAELVEANSVLVLNDGSMQYLMADAAIAVEDETAVCTSVSFLGLSKEHRAKVTYPCTRVTDELTLQQVIEVGEPVETAFDLVSADSEDTEPGTLIDKLEVVDNKIDPEDPAYPSLLQLESTVDGQGNRKVAINEDKLTGFAYYISNAVSDVIDTLNSMDFDEVPHAYLGSSLFQSSGDPASTGTPIDVFSCTSPLVGDCFEFEQTTTIDDVPFGHIWLEPGTYVINASIKCQWVGAPRGTFTNKVGLVMGENFDFSQEQELTRSTTRIQTVPARAKLTINVTHDAGTPVMGFWIQSMQVVKLAGGMSQTNVTHNSTLVGEGNAAHPLGVNTHNVAQSTLAGNVAPAFNAEHQYSVRECCVNFGLLFQCTTSHLGAWNPAHFSRISVDSFFVKTTTFDSLSATVDEDDGVLKTVTAFDDLTGELLRDYRIVTNVGVGNVVTLTPVASSGGVSAVESCKKYDRFLIRGTGGETYRLWCFIDGDNKTVSVSASNVSTTSDGLLLTAPVDGTFIFNSAASPSVGTPIIKKIVYGQDFYDKLNENCFVFVPQELEVGYIPSDAGIGNVVDTSSVNYNTGYRHVVIPCSKQDVFHIYGKGGNAPRTFCFTDLSKKVVNVCGESFSTGASGLSLVAPCDGYFIFNSSLTLDFVGNILCAVKTPFRDLGLDYKSAEKIENLEEKSLVKKDIIDFGPLSRGYITTNSGEGTTVSYSVTFDMNYVNVVRSCKYGEKFLIRGKGANAPRLWCFVDENDRIIKVSGQSVSTTSDGLAIEAPCDGKVIFNSSLTTGEIGTPYFKVDYNAQDYIDEKNAVAVKSIENLQTQQIEVVDEPYSGLTNYTSDITAVMTPDVMTKVYDKFDTLCTDYPDLITKYDAAELVDMAYPRYANGIGPDDGEYLETPAYKQYIYKISDINTVVGNDSVWPKKKLFIIGSIHGIETLAGVNLFAFASHILRAPSKDLFAMLSIFDIWLMPFANGYGDIHETRTNANGVDLNRNFGTINWAVDGTPGPHSTYTGPTADSEFETQLIEALNDYIEPDFFVDHHCAPDYGARQWYSITQSEEIRKTSYKAIVDFSRFLVKNWPEYYGTKYHLFNDLSLTGVLPKQVEFPSPGRSACWYYEHGVKSVILEICGHINYNGGEASSDVPFGQDVLVVNEGSLRIQLDNYLRTVL